MAKLSVSVDVPLPPEAARACASDAAVDIMTASGQRLGPR
jgi:hypothetical protein